MKNTISCLFICLSLLWIAPLEAQYKSDNQGITIYEHINFMGRSQTLGVGRHNASQFVFGCQALSSVRIPEGFKVIMYENQNFTGRKLELTTNKKYVGDEFNDLTSSIIVEKIAQSPSYPPTTTTKPTSSSTIFVGCPTGEEDIPADNAAYEQEVLRLTNAERAKKGLAPLVWDKDLARAARYHAADMFTDDYFDHNTHDKVNGREVMVCRTFERIGKFARGGAENIAINYSPKGTVRAWVNSPGHYRNMMGRYKKLGVGYYKNHWVQVFGF